MKKELSQEEIDRMTLDERRIYWAGGGAIGDPLLRLFILVSEWREARQKRSIDIRAKVLAIDDFFEDAPLYIHHENTPLPVLVEQYKAARKWLDWNQATVAARAGLTAQKVARFESGRSIGEPGIRAIFWALSKAGMWFEYDKDNGSITVKRRKEDPKS